VTDEAKGPTSDRITVLLADDHALVRRGFRRLLEDDPELAVVGEASDGEEAIALAASLRPLRRKASRSPKRNCRLNLRLSPSRSRRRRFPPARPRTDNETRRLAIIKHR